MRSIEETGAATCPHSAALVGDDLSFSYAQRQWLITALAFGSRLLISDPIADRVGRRKALLIGLADLRRRLGTRQRRALAAVTATFVDLAIAAITLVGALAFLELLRNLCHGLGLTTCGSG